MSTQLTLTITGIPDGVLDDMWKKFSAFSETMFDIKVTPTEEMIVDFKQIITLDSDGAIQMMSHAISMYATLTAMNEKQKFRKY